MLRFSMSQIAIRQNSIRHNKFRGFAHLIFMVYAISIDCFRVGILVRYLYFLLFQLEIFSFRQLKVQARNLQPTNSGTSILILRFWIKFQLSSIDLSGISAYPTISSWLSLLCITPKECHTGQRMALFLTKIVKYFGLQTVYSRQPER
jgi:hypothetical protein